MTKKQLIIELAEAHRMIRNRTEQIDALCCELKCREANYNSSIGALKEKVAVLEMAVEVYKEIIGTMRGVTKISPRDKGE